MPWRLRPLRSRSITAARRPRASGRGGLVRDLAKWIEVGLVTPVYLGPGMLVTPFAPEWGHAITRRWAQSTLRRWDITVEVVDTDRHLDNAGRAVFVHLDQASLLEGILWSAVLDKPFGKVLNIEFVLLPWMGWILGMQDAFVVVRQWPRQARAAIQAATEHVRGGGNVVISIEGRRSPDGSLSAYKKGPVVMAIAADAKIVPVTTHGIRECLPWGAWRVSGGDVRVVFHEAIDAAPLAYEDRDEVVRRLRHLGEQAVAGATG